MKRFTQCASRICVQGKSKSCIFWDQVHKLNQRTIFIHDLMFILLIPGGCPPDTLLWARGPSSKKNSSGISSRFHRVWGEHSRFTAAHTRVDLQGWFSSQSLTPSWEDASTHHSGISSMDLLPQHRTFPVLKTPHARGRRGIPTSAFNMGRSWARTLLDITKKHFWRPQGLALSWAGKGSCRHRLGEACRRQGLLLSPPDSPHPGRQQLTFIFTSQDSSVAILALEQGLEKAVWVHVRALYAINDNAAGTHLTIIGSNKEIHQTSTPWEHWGIGIPGCLGVWVRLAMREILLVSWASDLSICLWHRPGQGQGFGFASHTHLEQPTEIARFNLVRSGREKDTHNLYRQRGTGSGEQEGGCWTWGEQELGTQVTSQGEVGETRVGLQGKAGGNPHIASPQAHPCPWEVKAQSCVFTWFWEKDTEGSPQHSDRTADGCLRACSKEPARNHPLKARHRWEPICPARRSQWKGPLGQWRLQPSNTLLTQGPLLALLTCSTRPAISH